MQLKLKKPIVFFDLEATGVNVALDRIVEYSFLKVFPSGEKSVLSGRINPGVPIPVEASLIHGIYDQDVKELPLFKDVADQIISFIGQADIAGFNSNRYDVPLLVEEFLRADKLFSLDERKLVDVQVIFHKLEKRTLVAAYKFYCNKNLENAHSAAADIDATLEVLEAQLDKYDDLENDIDFLADFSSNAKFFDFAGRFILNKENQPVFNFGKHKGKLIMEVLKSDPGYYAWMMKGDFPRYTKQKLTEVLEKSKLDDLTNKYKS